MKPLKRESEMSYEKIVTNAFEPGTIEDIQYDMEHKFKFKNQEKIGQAVRFKFKLDNYKYPHYSRWMGFSYYSKGNLWKKYLLSLVENPTENMDFDLDKLKGMRVNTLWSGDQFQTIETIRTLESKVKVS